MAERQRPTSRVIGAMCVAFVLVLAAAILRAPTSNWDLALLGILLAFSIFSELTAVDTDSSLVIGGSFLAIVVAMVFLGGPPAALIGVLTILVGWLRWRSAWYTLLSNLTNYMAFPLIGGFAFHEAVAALGLTTSELSFYLCVFGLFLFALAINFTMTVS
jgi:hypothetical protein